MAELRLLLWVYAISGAYVLAMLFRRRGAFHPRYALFMALLVVVSGLGLLLPGFRLIAFWAASGAFFLFLVVPGVTVRLARRAAHGRKFKRALTLAKLSYALLPARALWRECEFYRAVHSGEIAVEIAESATRRPAGERIRTPVATAILLAVLLVYAVVTLLGDSGSHITLIDLGALHGAITFSGEPWRLVTSMFLHAGLLHLFMNVGAIWILGRWVEPEIGGARLIIVYFMGGISGGIASILYYGPGVLSIGASGGAMALVGCAAAYSLGSSEVVKRQRFSTLALIIGATILVGVMEPGIDNGAHVGGLVFGILSGLVFRRVTRFPESAMKVAAALTVTAVILSYGLLLSDRTAWRNPKRFESAGFSLERPALLVASEEEDGTRFADLALGEFFVSLHPGFDPPEALVSMRLDEIEIAIRKDRPEACLRREGPLPVMEPRNAWRGAILEEDLAPRIIYEVYAIHGRSATGMLTFTLPYGHEALREVLVPGVVTSFEFD